MDPNQAMTLAAVATMNKMMVTPALASLAAVTHAANNNNTAATVGSTATALPISTNTIAAAMNHQPTTMIHSFPKIAIPNGSVTQQQTPTLTTPATNATVKTNNSAIITATAVHNNRTKQTSFIVPPPSRPPPSVPDSHSVNPSYHHPTRNSTGNTKKTKKNCFFFFDSFLNAAF